MKTKFIAALLLATSASIAAPAFASGYGPAPFYNPEAGAPASQRGPSEQTLAAEQHDAATVARGGDSTGVGGTVESASSQSGSARTQSAIDALYRGR